MLISWVELTSASLQRFCSRNSGHVTLRDTPPHSSSSSSSPVLERPTRKSRHAICPGHWTLHWNWPSQTHSLISLLGKGDGKNVWSLSTQKRFLPEMSHVKVKFHITATKVRTLYRKILHLYLCKMLRTLDVDLKYFALPCKCCTICQLVIVIIYMNYCYIWKKRLRPL